MKRLVLVLALAAGCGGSASGPNGSFRGHFATNATVTGDYSLAVFASSIDGVVTGYGWVGIPGEPRPPVEPLIVTGQQIGNAVSITLAYVNASQIGALYGIFTGANEGGELHGDLSRSAQSFTVTFLRTDTTATARFDLTAGGAASAGNAGFATSGGFRLDLLRVGDTVPVLTLAAPSRPGTGTRAVGPVLVGTLRLPGQPAAGLATGTLTVEWSDSRAVIGRFAGQTGSGTEVTARFSAGCPTVCN